MTKPRSYYQILGIEISASDDELKRAYHRLANRYHPDKTRNDPEAEEIFKQINEAYHHLSDKTRRRLYDESLAPKKPESTLGRLFRKGEDLLEKASAPRAAAPERSGDDLHETLTLPLEDTFRDSSRQLQYRRHELCDACHGARHDKSAPPVPCSTCGATGKTRSPSGSQQVCQVCRGRRKVIRDYCATCRGRGRQLRLRTLEITIPAGIESGSRFRYRGEGSVGPAGTPGDLYVLFTVSEHPRFQRRGSDLYTSVSCPFVDAILGGTLTLHALDGLAALRIPEGTQHGTTIVLEGRGLPDRSKHSARGDLFVTLSLATPTQLTPEQRRALEAFRAASPDTELSTLQGATSD